MKRSELAYQRHSERLFAAVVNEPWSMFLDSGHPHAGQGRYDIIVARPHITLETHGARTVINQGGQTTESRDDPFSLLKKYLGRVEKNLSGPAILWRGAGLFCL